MKHTNLKKKLLSNQGINYKIMNDKKSLYNNNFYVDKCTLCGSQDKLEVHHILQQKDFKNGVYKELNKFHIVKDEEHNLMVLCMKCHDEVHLIKKH
jgi:5-methylcytosine-specific restriction endonuclease McrA